MSWIQLFGLVLFIVVSRPSLLLFFVFLFGEEEAKKIQTFTLSYIFSLFFFFFCLIISNSQYIYIFNSISARLILMKAFFSLGCLTIKPKPHQEQTQYVQRHSLPKSKVIPSWINGRSLYSFHTSKWVLRQNFLVQFLQMIPPTLNLSTQDTPNASDQISLVRSPWIFNLHCILLFLLLS